MTCALNVSLLSFVNRRAFAMIGSSSQYLNTGDLPMESFRNESLSRVLLESRFSLKYAKDK